MIDINGKKYIVAKDVVLDNGSIPLTWWSVTPNFGDLLSPYVIEKLTSLPVTSVNLRAKSRKNSLRKLIGRDRFSYFAIGSIMRRINSRSVVWGSGTFGTEVTDRLNRGASFRAVRGPITRNILRMQGVQCPEVYGDPALLLPYLFNPPTEKKYKIGIVLRWAEEEWARSGFGKDVKLISMSSSDIEGTITDMLACEKIISSSLHGVILADAYGIASAWLASTTPKGLESKFYDYFLSVNKVQKPQIIDFNTVPIQADDLEKKVVFDERKIEWDADKLMEACPFVERVTL